MPPALAALLAAAGFIAAARLFAKAIDAQMEAVRRAEEEFARRETQQNSKVTPEPKNLGHLEWDEAAGVYRPGPPRTL
jgi:hypothetical protein